MKTLVENFVWNDLDKDERFQNDKTGKDDLKRIQIELQNKAGNFDEYDKVLFENFNAVCHNCVYNYYMNSICSKYTEQEEKYHKKRRRISMALLINGWFMFIFSVATFFIKPFIFLVCMCLIFLIFLLPFFIHVEIYANTLYQNFVDKIEFIKNNYGWADVDIELLKKIKR